MYKNRYLAIIPARNGSKRLANKNILELGGKPLIAWTIEAALKSKYLDEVIVSTDSEEIASISKEIGAKVPFIRPDEISTDKSSSVDVVKHAIEYYSKLDVYFDYIVLLQPTSPLRSHQHIDEAIDLQIQHKANSVVSVCEMDHSPLWSNTLPANNSMENFIRPEVKGKRSQDLEPYYRLNGAIYIVQVSSFLEEEAFICKKNCYAYKMNKSSSVDIDDEMDLKWGEFILNEQ